MAAPQGGEDVNALVLDLGSCLMKAGYAGDDVPKAIFPSQVGFTPGVSNGMEVDGNQPGTSRQLYPGQSGLNYRRDHMEVGAPQRDEDFLQDWDMVEAVWSHTFKERLRANPSDFAMLLAEPSLNPKESREKTVELMFEKFGCPALYLARNAMLSSFATARQTSLVVDAGHWGTTVAAVHEGYVLTRTVQRLPLGGQVLTQCMRQGLESRGVQLRPRYSIKRSEGKAPGEWKVEDLAHPNTTASFHAYQVEQLAADIKESTCRVEGSSFEDMSGAALPGVSYELPDGTTIDVGGDRFRVPEVLFQPSLLKAFGPVAESLARRVTGGIDALMPLPALVFESINRADVDARKDLYQGVVLTGGTALLPGLRDRLERVLSEAGPSAAKIKVVMPANNLERRFSVWLGGSILASLGTFQQMWMSKKEYEEHGAGMIHRKCA